MRTPFRHHTAWLTAAVLCAALIVGSAVPAFGVTNAAIRAKARQADAASKKEQALGDELETRGEELAQIKGEVQDTTNQIKNTEAQLATANQNLLRSESMLDDRVTSIYRNGDISPISVLVGASDFSDFITRLDLMRRIGNSDASLVSSVKDAKAAVEATKRTLETKQSEQIALQSAASAKAAQVQSALATQTRYVASLKSDLKQLIVKEQKRQEAIAAKKAAEEAARHKRASGGSSGGSSAPVGALGSSHPQVVSVSARYLGVPYVWGGESPSGFDCSGLCQYCYAKIGIAIPRTSRAQFRIGAFIPRGRTDLLKPGDLVFFGTNGDANLVHHVAIYTGGGMMIEAPYTGADVRRSSLFARISSKGDYVGACRP